MLPILGFEVIGRENIPVDNPGIMVCPHGKTPVHIPPLGVILLPYRCRDYHLVIDRNHGNSPIARDFFQLLNMAGWTREECVKILQEGSDLVTLPGGSQELLHSDSNYEIDWSNRKGYARVAKEAKVFIVPTFCVNLQEAFWTPFFLKPFVSGRFSSKKFPIYFAWGGLPVKLVTVIGKPILWDESKTVDDMANETVNAVRQLRDANQRLPGNKFYALLDRFRTIKAKTNFPDV
uniref:Phospholipid/glycerol acyltransferase domain-containing protein n=1 Tax=Strigamia maritima TaxID=126957 RepID=T1IVQ8_STRMM